MLSSLYYNTKTKSIMKTKYFSKLFLALLFLSTGLAAQNSDNNPILISGTKFTYPLIEKWITEYTKINPNVQLKLVQSKANTQDPDLNVIAHFPQKDELKENDGIVYAGRYALLPVTNSKNPFLTSIAKKGLNKKDIDKLFFEAFNYGDDQKKEKPKLPATIYARENHSCASTALAGYFGHESSEIKGKKVLGDDIYLLSAVKKDTIGITYNNLGYLFDINTRKLKDGIALLPLDLKKDEKNVLSGNVDDAITLLERSQIETIPVVNFGFVYSQQNIRKEVSDFLKWVLTDGQKYNHGFGFLNLNKEVLAEQSNHLTERLLSLK